MGAIWGRGSCDVFDHFAFFGHLHAFLGIYSFCKLDDDMILMQNAVKQLQFTTPALPLVLVSISHDFV